MTALLDTDHLTVLKYRTGDRAVRLAGRVAAARAAGTLVGTTVVNVEEQMRGWMASLAKARTPHRQVGPYRALAELFGFLAGFPIALFDDAAADLFAGYSSIRIRTTDRKVAAIAVARGALLLTANRRDFDQVPGLRFENWMDA